MTLFRRRATDGRTDGRRGDAADTFVRITRSRRNSADSRFPNDEDGGRERAKEIAPIDTRTRTDGWVSLHLSNLADF